jgi:methylenetetrahydrofolate dehydrogenase (NADP+)/methenyltetrahydrofolate cyclohydrolase
MQNIINGKLVAKTILDGIAVKVAEKSNLGYRVPCLAVVLVGEDSASQVYVKNKKLACAKVGIKSLEYKLPQHTNEQDLLNIVRQLNENNTVDGILVQLPLPKHLNSKLVIDTISPDKDVDGFHRYNIGSLALNSPTICPCTPHGVIELLDSVGFQYSGKIAVVIGASNIVGRPMALELLNRGCTVTICNSKTPNLKNFTTVADVVVVAVGRTRFINRDYFNANAIVIDVGINRLEDGTICGDVDFESTQAVVKYITPVPGGVGPMTIAMLIKNTFDCYNKREF